MRLRHALLLCSISVALLLSGACTASAVDVNRVTKLPISDSYKFCMRASRDLIVYIEQPGGDDTTRNVGVWDVATGTEHIIAEDVFGVADVDDGTIVYSTRSDAGATLYAYDWASRTRSVIVSSPSFEDYFGRPRISGSRVTWEGVFTRNGDSKAGIWVADIETGQVDLIDERTNWEDYGTSPDISGDWVVYRRHRLVNGIPNGDIWAYRLSTGARITLCDEKHDQSYPVIADNGVVVWDDQRNAVRFNSDVDVYGCSVYNRTNFAVATGPKYQSEPSADGTIITYHDETAPGGYGIMGKDLLSGTTFGIAPLTMMGTERQDWTGISGGVIAWNKTRFIDDGSFNGLLLTEMYMALPTALEEVAGRDRFTTAVIASRSAYPDGADSAVIASGLTWADALAGSGLAGTDQPLLLTGPTALPTVTADELRRLGVTEVTILGGPLTISPAVEAQISAIVAENRAAAGPSTAAIGVTRFSGKTRIEAAERIAMEVATRPGWDGTVIVAASTTFADALAASPVAAHEGLPLVLASPSGLALSTADAIRDMGATRAIVLGGVLSVPPSVDASLTALLGEGKVTRLSGRDRYETAAAIAGFGVDTYEMSWDGLGIASGTAFADAMVGGVMKGKAGSVMVLTNGRTLSPATASLLKAQRAGITKGTYIGGSATVTKPVRGQVRTILK